MVNLTFICSCCLEEIILREDDDAVYLNFYDEKSTLCPACGAEMHLINEDTL